MVRPIKNHLIFTFRKWSEKIHTPSHPVAVAYTCNFTIRRSRQKLSASLVITARMTHTTLPRSQSFQCQISQLEHRIRDVSQLHCHIKNILKVQNEAI